MPSSFPIAQLFVAALVMAPSVLITPVHADVVYDTHTITASGPDTIGYTYFDLAASDTVEVRTGGPAIDPVLFLLRDDGSLTPDDMILFDDDSCPISTCGIAGDFFHALITAPLTAGHYVVAVGDFALSLADVVNGINTGNAAGTFGILTGDVTIRIASNSSPLLLGRGARALQVAADIPEPAPLALIALGLMLLFVVVGYDKRVGKRVVSTRA